MKTINLPKRPWRFEIAPGFSSAPFAIGRPVFNIYAADGYWFARVAAETESEARAIAKTICALGES